MTQQGLVSIIMPLYNCENYVSKTIDSVIAQTYTLWELVIVDDCSTDKSVAIIEDYIKGDSRIRLHKLNRNSGAAVARTKAMEIAEGEYMAFLDSDDLWDKCKLEKQIGFMKSNNYSFTCTAYEQVDEFGAKTGKVIHTLKKTDYNRLLLDCPVGNSTVMYNVDAMGKFEVPNIRKRNDDALWLQMLKKEKYIYGMPEVLAYYTVRQGSISHNKVKVIKYHWILYRDIEHLSVAKSIFHILYWIVIKLLHIK